MNGNYCTAFSVGPVICFDFSIHQLHQGTGHVKSYSYAKLVEVIVVHLIKSFKYFLFFLVGYADSVVRNGNDCFRCILCGNNCDCLMGIL